MTLIAGSDSVTGWLDLIEARPSLTLWKGSQRPAWYDAGPVRRGNDWPRYVAQPQTDVDNVHRMGKIESGGKNIFLEPRRFSVLRRYFLKRR